MSSASLTPLGVNSTASLLQNIGFWINPGINSYMGSSKINSDYTFGSIVQDSCLRLLTYSINNAYSRSVNEGVNAWYAVSQPGYWSSFMNNNAIWTNGLEDSPVTYNCNNMIDFPLSDNYTFEIAVDDAVTIFLDGIYLDYHNSQSSKVFTQYVSAGSHLLVLSVYNSGGPAGVALTIKDSNGASTWSSRNAIPIAKSSWYSATNGAWSSFMNSYAIWTGGATDVGTKVFSTALTFATTGTYTWNIAADNIISVAIDGEVLIDYAGFTGFTTITKYIEAGKHTVTLYITNQGGPAGGAVQIFNPSGSELWNTRSPNPLITDGPRVRNKTYDNLVSIGKTSIPILGNSPPSTYDYYDPSRKWSGQATTGYGLREDPNLAQGQSQTAQWFPFNCTNYNKSVTQWGWLRCYALQAWNDFNYNGIPNAPDMPQYKDFCSSFITAHNFVETTNKNIVAFNNSQTYLQGTYSNMDDLITADVTNITLATFRFGQDCLNLGKAVDLTKIASFGFPSVLLQTIQKYNGMTQSLSLALLSTGMTVTEIDNIARNIAPFVTKLQEQKIYGAFSIIVGRDLLDVLIPLNCKTAGLESLADLLNVQKMFPTSYLSLTVPVYNAIVSPTNSKTFYPIYSNGGVNADIQSATVAEQIGTLIPPGRPAIAEVNPNTLTGTFSPTTGRTSGNFQELPKGFGSYLVEILPNDIAVAAGAFSVTMRQVKNIEFVDFEKFSQVVGNIETTKGLPLINGTDIPTNLELAKQGQNLTALGSGPLGTYTMSDMLGCMSGLPYKWSEISALVSELETNKLYNIYHELYLAVTWDAATITVQYSAYSVVTNPGPPPVTTTYYKLTGITLTGKGGGYGRGNAPPPVITITGPIGATAVTEIGTNNQDLETFGKVTKVTITSTGTDTTTPPSVIIQCPPTATLPVNVDGTRNTAGVNTPSGTTGWNDPMDTVVQAYVTQANTEIADIKLKNEVQSKKLIDLYDKTGKQLKLEQRTRFIGLLAVAVPRDDTINPYPTTISGFIDLIPSYAAETLPHMAAQTLEAISNFGTIGGQSMVGLMRQARNTDRLGLLGIPLDTDIPVSSTSKEKKALISGNDTSTGTGVTPIGSFDAGGNFITADSIAGQVPINTGGPIVPGSLAGSRFTQLVPVELNVAFNSGTLTSGTYTVPEAIDTVIKCNCDCWLH